MAEDDDDEAFGDFAFAPFQSTFSQSNGLDSLTTATAIAISAAADDDEDDEWGEFVQTPQSEASINGNHKPDNSASPSWVKPSGALPLSLFGDEVEEGEEVSNYDVARDLNNQGKSNGKSGDFNFGKVENGVHNSHSFSIADLYNQYSQSKPGNREGSDSTGKVDLVENGDSSRANQNGSRSPVTELKNVELNDTQGKSDLNQLTTNNSENEEFSFGSYMLDPSGKEDDLFGGWTQEFNGFSSNSNAFPGNVQMSSSSLDMDAQEQQVYGSATPIDGDGDDEDDDGWEFQDAYSDFRAPEVNKNVS